VGLRLGIEKMQRMHAGFETSESCGGSPICVMFPASCKLAFSHGKEPLGE